MSEKRKHERRKWGRKVTYPFIDSDGTLVTKNRRRLVDRRGTGAGVNEQQAAPPEEPPVLSDAQPSVDVSESEKKEIEDEGPISIIDTSIKEIESQILDATTSESTPKSDTSSSSSPDPQATTKQTAKSKPAPTAKSKPTPAAKSKPAPIINENDKSESIELTFKNKKYLFSKDQNFFILGRDPSCNLVIEGRYASRVHAKITYRHGMFVLQDNSVNGTYIDFDNGKKIHASKNDQLLISDGIMSVGEPVKNNKNSAIKFKIL